MPSQFCPCFGHAIVKYRRRKSISNSLWWERSRRRQRNGSMSPIEINESSDPVGRASRSRVAALASKVSWRFRSPAFWSCWNGQGVTYSGTRSARSRSILPRSSAGSVWIRRVGAKLFASSAGYSTALRELRRVLLQRQFVAGKAGSAPRRIRWVSPRYRSVSHHD